MPSSQDSKGRSLSVGDVVSWDEDMWGKPTGRTNKGTIQHLEVQENYRDHSEFVMATVYRSARSVTADYLNTTKLTLLEHGQPISKAAFAAAKKRRADMKAARPFKPLKLHLICFTISHVGQPMKRVDILRRVHALEGSQLAFKEGSNVDYFSANSAHPKSLLNQGLIRITNGKGYSSKDALFDLTAKGREKVKEYEDWCNS